MLTLRLDQLVRWGPLCAVMTFAVPAALAVLINANRNQDDILGILLVACGIIFIGTIAGSAVSSGAGVVLFSMGAALAEPPVWVLTLVGAGLLITMVVHDLAGVLHRSPRVTPGVWRNTALATAAVIMTSTAAFALSYAVGRIAIWQSIVVPFGIAAIGFGAKLAADSHRSAAQQLTAKRLPEPSSETPVGQS